MFLSNEILFNTQLSTNITTICRGFYCIVSIVRLVVVV